LYLRHGSVYQMERGVGSEFHSEFFWLCANCSSAFKVSSDSKGKPLLSRCGPYMDGHQRCYRVRRVFRGVLQESLASPMVTSAGVRARAS
jgi:hypothetical protein